MDRRRAARVGQRTDHVEELDDRARPPVADDQRERVRLGRAHVQEVDALTVDLGDEVLERVEARLDGTPVEVVAPVRHAAPAGTELRSRLPPRSRDLVRKARAAPAARAGRRSRHPGRRPGTARSRAASCARHRSTGRSDPERVARAVELVGVDGRRDEEELVGAGVLRRCPTPGAAPRACSRRRSRPPTSDVVAEQLHVVVRVAAQPLLGSGTRARTRCSSSSAASSVGPRPSTRRGSCRTRRRTARGRRRA